jgi:hypothetical protein
MDDSSLRRSSALAPASSESAESDEEMDLQAITQRLAVQIAEDLFPEAIVEVVPLSFAAILIRMFCLFFVAAFHLNCSSSSPASPSSLIVFERLRNRMRS